LPLAALRSEAYFRERAARADIPGALKILDRLGVGNARVSTIGCLNRHTERAPGQAKEIQ